MDKQGLPLPPFETPVGRAEELIPALLVLLVLFAIGGVVAFPASIWPLQTDDVLWRERAGEMYLMTMPPLVFTVTIMLIAGVYAGQYRVVRAGAVVFFLLAALTVVVLPFFALDFLAVRYTQSQDELGGYMRNGIRLAATGVVMIPFLIYAGRRAWYSGRPLAGAGIGEGHGLVVGRAPDAP